MLGNDIKNMRKLMGISYKKIEELTYIKEETIREIENLTEAEYESKECYQLSTIDLALRYIAKQKGMDYWRVFEYITQEEMTLPDIVVANTLLITGDYAVFIWDDKTQKVSQLQLLQEEAADEYGEHLQELIDYINTEQEVK